MFYGHTYCNSELFLKLTLRFIILRCRFRLCIDYDIWHLHNTLSKMGVPNQQVVGLESGSPRSGGGERNTAGGGGVVVMGHVLPAGGSITPTSGKTHRCPYCPYSSSITTNIFNHMRIHTGERPFSCPYCPYRANQRTNLKTHMRIHTGEKPYACSQCPYRSSNKGGLDTHMWTRHCSK